MIISNFLQQRNGAFIVLSFKPDMRDFLEDENFTGILDQFPFAPFKVVNRTMSLLALNSHPSGYTIADHPCKDPSWVLRDAIEGVPKDAPIVVMIHGYKFSPFVPRNNPHRSLFAYEDQVKSWKTRSWPRQMQMCDFDGYGGLAICFGWHAKSQHALPGPALRDVYDNAALEGQRLAQLFNDIHSIAPGRKIDVICHSLGARVLLSALPNMASGIIGRAILMGAAEFGARVVHALDSPAGRHIEFYNITARRNDLYDLLFERMVERPGPKDRALGMGFNFADHKWVNIQIDDNHTLGALDDLGIELERSNRPICHWSFYLGQGMFTLYRAILHRHSGFAPHELHRQLNLARPPCPPRSAFALPMLLALKLSRP